MLVSITVSINSLYSTLFSFLYISSDNCCVACKSADKYSDNSSGGISATEKPFLKYSFSVSCFCVANSYLSAHASSDNAFLTPRCSTYSPSIVSKTGPVYSNPHSHIHIKSCTMLCPISIVQSFSNSCILVCASVSVDILNRYSSFLSVKHPTIINSFSVSNGSRCSLPSLVVTVFSTSSVSFI